MSAAARTTVEKISARVFCQWKGTGGNPVTIFASDKILAKPVQEQLARSCEWESVMVDRSRPQMNFYMPTGEEVSFCAHAAMGGALQLASEKRAVDFFDGGEQQYEAQLDPEDGIVSLHMAAQWTEDRLSHSPTLQRLLRDSLGLQPSDLTVKTPASPTFCNASIARPKTLVQVKSVDALHKATAPGQPDHFRVACDAVDDSTGIYLYAQRPGEEFEWECRQFPRASGYPEDPATGIAAAALAASLDYRKPLHGGSYKFHQGTAMGKGSLIMVDKIKWAEARDANLSGGLSFRLIGHVQIDRRETEDV